jgi:hypothetical protein
VVRWYRPATANLRPVPAPRVKMSGQGAGTNRQGRGKGQAVLWHPKRGVHTNGHHTRLPPALAERAPEGQARGYGGTIALAFPIRRAINANRSVDFSTQVQKEERQP